jgi:hypothetical protein
VSPSTYENMRPPTLVDKSEAINSILASTGTNWTSSNSTARSAIGSHHDNTTAADVIPSDVWYEFDFDQILEQ